MPAVVDVSDYERLWRATRTMPAEIRRSFRRHLRDAAKVGQRAARVKIRQMPATKKYSKAGAGQHYRKRQAGVGVGLRSTLALNVRVEVTSRGAAIRQYTAGLRGRNARDLPKVLERGTYGVAGGWFHPVFGHADRQVFQRAYPYFEGAIEGKREEMTTLAARVFDDIADHLTKGL